jgi:cell shape-determining protein MreC
MPGKPFADVLAKPSAQLDRSRHVLLVFTETRVLEETNTSSGKGDDRGG